MTTVTGRYGTTDSSEGLTKKDAEGTRDEEVKGESDQSDVSRVSRTRHAMLSR